MKRIERLRREQRSATYVGMLLFNMLLLLIQMWLFVATLNNFLEGRYAVAIPAAFLSVGCAGVNAWMLAGLARMEKSRCE